MEKDGGVHKQCSKGLESTCEREVRPCVVLLSSPRCLPHSETDKCQRYCGPAEALKSPMLFAEVTNPFMRRCWLLVTHMHKSAHTLLLLFFTSIFGDLWGDAKNQVWITEHMFHAVSIGKATGHPNAPAPPDKADICICKPSNLVLYHHAFP